MKNILTLFANNIISLKTISFFIVIDYITAVLVAIYQKKLNSSIGYKGIIKKIGTILCIALVYQIDVLHLLQESIKLTPIVISFFTFNEIISCFENLNKLDIPMPEVIKNIIQKIKI